LDVSSAVFTGCRINGATATILRRNGGNSMSTSFEGHIVMMRVVMTLAETMSPRQLQEAAEKLRGLKGDESDRTFFAGIADALDDYARANDS
jgi:hypothetical protein